MTAPRIPATLRLGTRASLLAVAQSRQIAAQLEQAHPGLQIELVTYGSRGDSDQQTPLTQVSDRQFFSDELDQALANGAVDFCVHSWKDIDGPRPAEFLRAAVPARALPHDALLFRSDIAEVLKNGRPLRIGTSSARRQINTGDFLAWALPRCGAPPRCEFQPLRGPVHQRLARIAPTAGSDRLDGVVLALAGLERLWQDSDGRDAIAAVLNAARWMIMPLSASPAAAAQGALALETRRDNDLCISLLRAVHDPETARLVGIEQQLLQQVAGDAAGFGATAVSDPVLGFVARLRGRTAGRTAPICITRVADDRPPAPAARAWSGHSWQRAARKHRLPATALQAPAMFVAHADAIDATTDIAATRLWTSGPRSWATLARQGLWVEGCADNLGFDALKPLLAAPVLQLPPLADWLALTHAAAVASWDGSGIGRTVATYNVEVAIDPQEAARELQQCDHFYWSSARQYGLLKPYLPAQAQHACGPGKTYRALRAAGVTDVRPFASRQEWQRWLA